MYAFMEKRYVKGVQIMDEIVNLILQGSNTLDAPAIVRLVVMLMGLELFTVACGFLGGMKK